MMVEQIATVGLAFVLLLRASRRERAGCRRPSLRCPSPDALALVVHVRAALRPPRRGGARRRTCARGGVTRRPALPAGGVLRGRAPDRRRAQLAARDDRGRLPRALPPAPERDHRRLGAAAPDRRAHPRDAQRDRRARRPAVRIRRPARRSRCRSGSSAGTSSTSAASTTSRSGTRGCSTSSTCFMIAIGLLFWWPVLADEPAVGADARPDRVRVRGLRRSPPSSASRSRSRRRSTATTRAGRSGSGGSRPRRTRTSAAS